MIIHIVLVYTSYACPITLKPIQWKISGHVFSSNVIEKYKKYFQHSFYSIQQIRQYFRMSIKLSFLHIVSTGLQKINFDETSCVFIYIG
jgi:hypothetical protein